jgi:hypothetical protein
MLISIFEIFLITLPLRVIYGIMFFMNFKKTDIQLTIAK